MGLRELLAQRVFSIACGYPDANDSARLASGSHTDPAATYAAVANAVERSFAMGASGVAKRPTMTDCEILGAGLSVSPPTIRE